MMKKTELTTSFLLLAGLLLPMFWSKEQMVGIFTLPNCLDRCPEPGGICAILLFILGWIVLFADFVRCQLLAFQKRDDRKVLGQMWFWCMLLLFFRIQNSETLYFGTTHPFIGWWLLILGIAIKFILRTDRTDPKAIAGLKRLSLLSLIIAAASVPFLTGEVIPDYEREMAPISVPISIGSMFFSDLFRTKASGSYLIPPLRFYLFALILAVLLFTVLQLQLRQLTPGRRAKSEKSSAGQEPDR